jgi:hypothetical protein
VEWTVGPAGEADERAEVMPDELVRRLRANADLCLEAAEAVDTLLAELKASIDQRERLIDAIRKSQAELRALQDMVIAPKDDGL